MVRSVQDLTLECLHQKICCRKVSEKTKSDIFSRQMTHHWPRVCRSEAMHKHERAICLCLAHSCSSFFLFPYGLFPPSGLLPRKPISVGLLCSRKLNGGQEGRRLHVRARSCVDPITQEPDRLNRTGIFNFSRFCDSRLITVTVGNKMLNVVNPLNRGKCDHFFNKPILYHWRSSTAQGQVHGCFLPY